MTEKEKLIKETFGRNERYSGYSSICDTLIKNGECISTIYAKDIFNFGGICNFIHTYKYDGGVDLVRIVFDKEDFLKSKMFEEYVISTIEDMEVELKKKQQEVFNIQKAISELKL